MAKFDRRRALNGTYDEAIMANLRVACALAPGEEAYLHGEIALGNNAAQARLAEAFQRLVWDLALKVYYKLPRGRLAIEDLYQAGNLGLLEAIRTFDSKAKIYLVTWVIRLVKQAIRKEARNMAHTIRVPRDNYRAKPHKVYRLDMDNNDNEESRALLLGSIVAKDTEHSDTERVARVYEALEKLTVAYRRALNLRYGLNGRRQHSLLEASVKLKKSRLKMRRLETNALQAFATAYHSGDKVVHG